MDAGQDSGVAVLPGRGRECGLGEVRCIWAAVGRWDGLLRLYVSATRSV